MPALELTAKRIDLWIVLTDQAASPDLLDRYRELLSPDERQQEHRLRLDRVKHEFLVTRALVRTVLSDYLEMPPAAIVFNRSSRGKPAVTCPGKTASVEFNLSHTRGLVVCAVTTGCEIGVDAEPLDRRSSCLELAARFFAPTEFAALQAIRIEEQQQMFLRFWTLKEAFIKAEGLGLSAPLDQFWFTLTDGTPSEISFATGGPLQERPWQFAEIRFADAYQIALAVPRPATQAIELHVGRTVPLLERSELERLPCCPSRCWAIA